MSSYSLDLQSEGDTICATLRSSSGRVLAQSQSQSQFHSDRGGDPALERLRSRGSLDAGELERLGAELAEASCPGPVRESLMRLMSMERISLSLRVGEELEALPWELIHLGGSFLARHPSVRLSRRLEGQREFEPTRTFKLLAAFADPQSPRYPGLGKVADEFDAVCVALSPPAAQLEAMPHATAGSLSRALTASRFDGFHFIGHGDLRPSGGLLVLEGGSPNEASEIHGDELSRKLLSAGARVVVLSACQTGASSSSIGFQLARAGIPVVVAMQAPVSDAVACLFARALYAAILQRLSIEEAVFEARTAIGGAGQDWAAPVLLTASPSSAILGDVGMEPPAKTNLPKPLTSFVGRRYDIEHGVNLLSREPCVTLLGSGGIGKTRLSIEVARRAASLFEHGVWQVRLEAVEADNQVWEAVGQVFGIRGAVDAPIDRRVLDFLSDRRLLLVLDNCEHVIEGCRDAVRSILSDCPGVKILATSREVLGAGLDCVVRIPSLSYPSEGTEAKSSLLAGPLLDSYEAVQLLVVRAKSADSRFAASNRNVHTFAQIARRLDGIPLALELAASRVRTLSPAQILERLRRDLAWLDVENPGAVPRHKTLRAAIDWSYRLLSEPERALFNRLGVLVGSFSLEGAEAVGGTYALDGLSNLVDKSLVVAEPFGDRMRYRLLDTCRKYALEKLDASGETQTARTDHLQFMQIFADEAFQGMFRDMANQSRWFAEFAAEQDNCLAALHWALEDGADPVRAATMAKGLFHYWYSVRNFGLADRVLRQVLERLPAEEEFWTIQTLSYAGASAVFCGDPTGLDLARAAMAKAVDAFPELAMGTVSTWLGECAYMLGEFDLASEVYDRMIEYQRRTGKGEGIASLMAAILHAHKGLLEQATEELVSFVAERELKNDHRSVGYALCHLARLDLLRQGNLAHRLFERGLRKLYSVHDVGAISEFLPMASVVFLPDRPEKAAVIQGFAEKVIEESDSIPDRLAEMWGVEVKDQTKSLIPDTFNRFRRDGRTMTLELVLGEFSGGPGLGTEALTRPVDELLDQVPRP